MKLLIVDDSDIIRSRIVSEAIDCGSIDLILMAGDGESALQKYWAHLPDLVILDLHMPGQNGFKVMRQLQDAQANARICILTGHNYPEYREYCLSMGATYFLCKNEDFEKLKDIIAREIMLLAQSEHPPDRSDP